MALLLASTILQVGCERAPRLVEYQDPGGVIHLESVPIIIVGRIEADDAVGSLHPSRWYPDEPMQLYKINVRVENALRGDPGAAVVRVYYLISIRRGGHARMGMVGRGGHWQIGDRAIFFLRRDSGVLRTVVDTWASATPPFLTGAHPGYKPRPNESIADSIVDILLDRGQECGDKQWALAISVSHGDFWDLAYTVRKLRQIAAGGTPLAQEAAKKELENLSYSWPKIRQGWPERPSGSTNE